MAFAPPPPLVSLVRRRTLAIVRVHLVVNCIAYAPFWLWFAAAARGAHVPQVAWMTGFGTFVVLDFIVHTWQLAIMPRMAVVNPVAPLPVGRVAMIVTKAPCEPWAVVERTLRGMLGQDTCRDSCARVVVDVWLADEDPSAGTLAWCAFNGVRVSCRKGVAGYHNPDWPRRTRCKEGNLAFFYDTHGYKEYDFVFQFDSDHTPDHDYLAHSLPAFADPRVAYVAMPSINRAGSWISEARQTQEAWYYGPSQMSYSYSYMPMMTGSHYAVRTSALRSAGGIGPELDEDMTTTMMFAAAGFRGVYAGNAIAFGDGPETFDDAAKQEFQWAKSAVICYVRWRKLIFPRTWTAMGLGTWFRVFVVRTWYPLQLLWFVFLWAFGAPLAVFATGGRGWCAPGSCHLSLLNLMLRLLPIAVCQWSLELLARRNDWLRARGTPFWSVDLVVYRVVRPVWISMGLVAGLLELAFGKVPSFGVTPKGREGVLPLRVTACWPFMLLQTGYCAMLMTGTSAVSLPAMLLALMLALVLVHVWVVARHFASQKWRAVSLRNSVGHVACLAFMAASVVVPAVLKRDRLFGGTSVFAVSTAYRGEETVACAVGVVVGSWALAVLASGRKTV